jgi:hypothetical protein
MPQLAGCPVHLEIRVFPAFENNADMLSGSRFFKSQLPDIHVHASLTAESIRRNPTGSHSPESALPITERRSGAREIRMFV